MKRILICLILGVTALAFPGLVHASDDISESPPEIQFASPDAVDLRSMAAQLGTPVAIYEYLRNNAEYSLYHGSRSGSINSFGGLRGNDVDLASTLIAMYRSRGIHSRYVVGTVRVAAGRVMNWLGVTNLNLAVSIMQNQGIQGVTLDSDNNYVQFEHAWVEAHLPYGNYRGAGSDAANFTCGALSDCHWVALDPSFKQKVYNNPIDVYNTLQFDYTSYYNAMKNNDQTRKDRNPLDIYENQILGYLGANYPGKTIEDVAYTGAIVNENTLILPAGLPYTVVGAPRRYNSVADHDTAVPVTEPKKWGKTLSLQIGVTFTTSGGGTLTIQAGGGSGIPLASLATQRLTMTTEIDGSAVSMVVRQGGTVIATPISAAISGYTPAVGDPFTLKVSMDGTPAATAQGTDEVISATYDGIVGGYYLLATGGETSNWSQVHRAATQLLQSDHNYKIVFNPSESGCQTSTGMSCTPYIDTNGTGFYESNSDQRLLDNKQAMDDLTGGLLYVAAMQYFTKLREDIDRVDALNHVKTPISGFLGVVSSTHEVEYVAGTAFSVLPGGLLIDMKGITVTGSWRIDQPSTFSNSQFEIIGHIVSSLEHETWQELTGYDAISTVRGIQMALAPPISATLLNPIKNGTTDTLPGLYASFGFAGSVPAGFAYAPFSLWSTAPAAWTDPVDGAAFDLFKAAVNQSTSSNRLSNAEYVYSTSFGLYGWCNCISVNANQLQTWINQGYGNSNLGTQTVCSGTFSGTVSQYYTQLQSYYLYTVIPYYVGQAYFTYFDRNQGFVPADYVYRAAPRAANAYSTSYVTGLRNNLYLHDSTQYWVEYLLPSTMVNTGANYFAVDIFKAHDATTSNLQQLTFEIQNNSISAGGGYVDGSRPLVPAKAIVGTSLVTPTFNNAVFTDQNTVSLVNNDTVRTPSTADPVSTVTGNNYHDETDFTIKGRGGLDFVFTRTYNSAPSSTSQTGPVGNGWTHSYNMKLESNDYGVCPNCTQGTGAGQRPENGNNKTSSITFVDERGGEHNYLVDETTFAVTPPTGEFSTLALDTPVAGTHTLTFRNGTRYVFQASSGDNLKTTPGKTARLASINDPYGNSLSFTYTGGNLASITDGLGRTLNLAYSYNLLQSIVDWSGRAWSFTYDSFNLASAANPLGHITKYAYTANTHNLTQVILPEARSGGQVATTFTYYQNGKTFNYADTLGDTETLDYDLYRKTTRVTDPRGFIRQYEYDENGLMTKLTEPDNGILQFSNDPATFQRTRKTDGLGYPTSYSYDFYGNVAVETDPLSRTLQYQYGTYDQVTQQTDKNGNNLLMTYYPTGNGNFTGKLKDVTVASLNGSSNVKLRSYTYNSDGTINTIVEYVSPDQLHQRVTTFTWQNNGLNLQSVTVTGSGTTVQTAYTYDNLGRRTSQTLNRGGVALTTSYGYDALDRVTSVTDPSGNVAFTIYDGNGKVTRTTYAGRLISTATYDAADRMVTNTDVYGNTTSYAYDASGNVTSATDPNGHVIRYQYDAMNRRTAITEGNGFTSQTVYDLAGRAVQAVNPLGKAVATSYDALGRPLTVTDPMGFQTAFSYDANGNVTSITDANGKTTSKIYDELGRVTRETDALNGQTNYTYDLVGNITSIKDANNNTTSYIYDDLGRLVTTTDPLGRSTAFTYDEAGNVLTRTKRSGAQSVYTYDTMNRVTRAQHTQNGTTITETTAYDTFGNVTSIGNGNVTYTFGYDQKNRMTSKTDSRVNKSLLYSYDRAGNIATKTNYDGSVTQYLYDGANRLVSEQNQYYLQVSYYYDAAGRLLNRILSNGSKTAYTWDDDNRLTGLTTLSANGAVINQTTYLRDHVGNITSQTDTSGTTTFTYDNLYRLLTATYPNSANNQTYTYDSVGNRLTMTKNGVALAYVYDAANRLNEIHQGQGGPLQNSFVYDFDGNMTARKDGSGATIQSIAYDAKGQPSNIQGNTFTYDPFGYRIAKTDSTGSKTYLLEGEHLEAVMSGSNFTATYFRGAVVDEIVNGYQVAPSNKWVNYTFHHDNLQSVLGLSGHDGAVLQTISYGPFGDKIATSGSANNNALHFTGREEDPDSGLYYYRARYYDPAIGRFITEDPKGFDAGVNFYAYAGNNPINANDPYGLYQAVTVYMPNGTQYVPMTTVKNSGQAGSFGVPVGTQVAIPVPPGVDLQALVNSWRGATFNGMLPLGWFWRQYGPNDYKRQAGVIYDAAGNFGFGATGAAAGQSLSTLQAGGDLVHLGNNYPENKTDIQSGYNAISQGGTLSTTEYIIPQMPIYNNANSLGKYDISGSLDVGDQSAAAGGYLIYPNKPNTNMTRAVYAK